MKVHGFASLIALAIAGALVLPESDAQSAQSRSETPRGMQLPAPSGSAPAYRGDGSPASGDNQYAENGFGCLIKPHTEADIGAGTPGILTEIRVRRGDRVKRGQIVAVLDNEVEQALLQAAEARAAARAEISAARATHRMADAKVTRMRSLNELSYGAALELELASGELDVSAYRVEQARERHKVASREYQVAATQLEQRYVRSPIDGVIADQLINPGERTDGRTIARVIRLDMLRVEVIAPSRYYGKISEGMIGQISTETSDSIQLAAIVNQVDAYIDPASSTFRAQMLIDNSDLKVPAGARCRVSFDTNPVVEKQG